MKRQKPLRECELELGNSLFEESFVQVVHNLRRLAVITGLGIDEFGKSADVFVLKAKQKAGK